MDKRERNAVITMLRVLTFSILVVYTLVSASIVTGLYTVKGESMSPTIKSGAMVLVQKGATNIKPGDLVVYNANPYGDQKELAVKRVIGAGGDMISYDNGLLSVNGIVNKEHSNEVTDTHLYSSIFQLGHNEYWLIGDNMSEGASIDSRTQGIVKGKDIVGKVIRRGN